MKTTKYMKQCWIMVINVVIFGFLQDIVQIIFTKKHTAAFSDSAINNNTKKFSLVQSLVSKICPE